MTKADKLARVKLMLGDDVSNADDATLNGYLDLAKDAIIGHICTVAQPSTPLHDVPSKYDMVQVFAVVAGYNLIGAEGEIVHIENSIDRHFKYEDMLAYIEGHVLPYARIV